MTQTLTIMIYADISLERLSLRAAARDLARFTSRRFILYNDSIEV